MAIVKDRFRQLLEEGHEESISAGGPDDGRQSKGEQVVRKDKVSLASTWVNGRKVLHAWRRLRKIL